MNLRNLLIELSKELENVQLIYENEEFGQFKLQYLQKYIDQQGQFLYEDPNIDMKNSSVLSESFQIKFNNNLMMQKMNGSKSNEEENDFQFDEENSTSEEEGMENMIQEIIHNIDVQNQFVGMSDESSEESSEEEKKTKFDPYKSKIYSDKIIFLNSKESSKDEVDQF